MEEKSKEEIQIKVKVTAKDLWHFSLFHANGGTMGIFNLLFTLASLGVLILRFGTLSAGYRALLVFCVLLFPVIQPLMLYNKARKQAKSPMMKEAMLLDFNEEGLKVTQGEQEAKFAWDMIARVQGFPGLLVVYMDRVHAYLIPDEAAGEEKEALLTLVRSHVPKELLRRIP